MPAYQHCDLFYPLVGDLIGSAINLGNAPVPRSGTGFWVLIGQSGACHPLSPVIRLGFRNPRKKERKNLRTFAGTLWLSYPVTFAL